MQQRLLKHDTVTGDQDGALPAQAEEGGQVGGFLGAVEDEQRLFAGEHPLHGVGAEFLGAGEKVFGKKLV